MFDPIPDSLGKTYTFYLGSPDAGDTEVLYSYLTFTAPTWFGDAYYQGELVDGKVSFVTYHAPASKFELLGNIYGDWVKRILDLKI